MTDVLPAEYPLAPKIYFGGSFDPVHIGHLSIAKRIHESITQLDVSADIRFLPTAGSPLKQTQTSTDNRVAMLKLALAETPFSLDLREIQQQPPVYSIDTLKTIRKELNEAGQGDTPVIFVMGLDSLRDLPKWKNGLALLNYCHFWVFDRSNTIQQRKKPQKNKKSGEKMYHSSESLAQYAPDLLQDAVTDDLHQLINHSHGYIFFDEMRPPTVSSSEIRCHITVAKRLVSSSVWEYIEINQLYRTP